jgi:hypothetical protein
MDASERILVATGISVFHFELFIGECLAFDAHTSLLNALKKTGMQRNFDRIQK